VSERIGLYTHAAEGLSSRCARPTRRLHNPDLSTDRNHPESIRFAAGLECVRTILL